MVPLVYRYHFWTLVKWNCTKKYDRASFKENPEAEYYNRKSKEKMAEEMMREEPCWSHSWQVTWIHLQYSGWQTDRDFTYTELVMGHDKSNGRKITHFCSLNDDLKLVCCSPRAAVPNFYGLEAWPVGGGELDCASSGLVRACAPFTRPTSKPVTAW